VVASLQQWRRLVLIWCSMFSFLARPGKFLRKTFHCAFIVRRIEVLAVPHGEYGSAGDVFVVVLLFLLLGITVRLN